MFYYCRSLPLNQTKKKMSNTITIGIIIIIMKWYNIQFKGVELLFFVYISKASARCVWL